MLIDIKPVAGEYVSSDGLLALLTAEEGKLREVVGVFASADLAKAHALELEKEHAEDDPEAGEIELEWLTGANEVGDAADYTPYDMTYSGAQYTVEPVHLNPRLTGAS
jgi:hypothetical protein